MNKLYIVLRPGKIRFDKFVRNERTASFPDPVEIIGIRPIFEPGHQRILSIDRISVNIATKVAEVRAGGGETNSSPHF